MSMMVRCSRGRDCASNPECQWIAYTGRLPDITLLGCVLATSVLGYTWWQRLYPAPPPRKSSKATCRCCILTLAVSHDVQGCLYSSLLWPFQGYFSSSRQCSRLLRRQLHQIPSGPCLAAFSRSIVSWRSMARANLTRTV